MSTLRVPYDLLDYEVDGFCRWEGKPFTGVACELDTNGTLRSETEYVDGVEEGSKRSWYPSGKLRSESVMHFDPPLSSSPSEGGCSGIKRVWFENGQLESERIIKYSFEIVGRGWDENGTLVYEREMNEHSPNYDLYAAKLRRLNRTD